MWPNRVAAAIALACLAACSQAAPQRMNVAAPAAQPAPRCDSAVGSATMFSKASAIHYAKARLSEEIGETKADLNGTPGGIARAGDTVVHCEPYFILGQRTSLVTCLASTQVCAN